MARKREERAIRAAHQKEKKAQAYMTEDMNFVSFQNQLNAMGLQLKDIPGDGNCLFRALGDQLEGHSKNHMQHRHDVVHYMLQHRHDFEPFVEDDVPFQRHVNNLKKPGTYAGNDVIVAFARLHGVTVVIHQMNSPVWQINGSEKTDTRQLHISYHNGDHYSSVRKIGDTSNQPTNIKLSVDGKTQMPKVENKKAQGDTKQFHVHHSDATGEYTWQTTNDDFDTMDAHVVYDESPLYSATALTCNDGVARATRTSEDYVQTVARETGCHDQNLILDTLVEKEYDIEASVCEILTILANQESCGHGSVVLESAGGGIWSENGTGSRIFGDTSNTGAKPKKQSTNAKLVAKQKKQEKKARATERHRQRLVGTESRAGATAAVTNYSDDDTVILQNMGSLVI